MKFARKRSFYDKSLRGDLGIFKSACFTFSRANSEFKFNLLRWNDVAMEWNAEFSAPKL